MDGTTKDSIKSGILFRPVSQNYAVNNFVPLVIELSKSVLSPSPDIIPIKSGDGLVEIVVRGKKKWQIRIEDYDKCVNIVFKISKSIFRSWNEGYEETVRMYIRQEFSDRSPFL